MPTLIRPKQFQAVQRLPFCYLCAKPFAAGEDRDRDHVPQQACFAIAHRSPPLILPTHRACNGANKVSDERVGQFISLRDRRVPKRENRRLKLMMFSDPDSGRTYGTVTNVNIRGAIERWVRAFHAALYQEPLSPETMFGIDTPFPVAVPTVDGPVIDRERPQRLLFVEIIKRNRETQNLDRIACNQGRVRYECVWTKNDAGGWICVFALDVYSWRELGDINNFPPRGCAGFYVAPSASKPPLGTVATRLDAPVRNTEPLDPFGG